MELYKPEDISTLCLGVQGENKSRIIQIDVSDWLKEFPNANINILVTRPTETTPYIANTSVINGIFTWLISDSDTTYSGLGKAELRATQDDIIKKSLTYLTSIKESLEGVPSPLPPEPSESWVNAVIEKANEVLNSRVESFNINEQGHLIATLEDGTTEDLGSVVGSGGVSSVNGQTGDVILTANDLNAYTKTEVNTELAKKQDKLGNVYQSGNTKIFEPQDNIAWSLAEGRLNFINGVPTVVNAPSLPNDITNKNYVDNHLPTKTSDLTNDSGFVTNAVNDLTNYYTKTETNTELAKKQKILQVSGNWLDGVGRENIGIYQCLDDFISPATAKTYKKGYFYEVYINDLNYVDVKEIPTTDITGLAEKTYVDTELSTKLTEPSSDLAVGKYFRIASIDENGHAVLECVDAPTPIEKDYELIQKVIIGYSITTTQPADWSTNYTDYFVNTGSIREPIYSAVQGETAPVWEEGMYYSFSNSITDLTIRKEPNGENYNFKKIRLEIAQEPSSSTLLAFSINDSGTGYPIALANTKCYFVFEAEIQNGRLYVRCSNAVNKLSVGQVDWSNKVFNRAHGYLDFENITSFRFNKQGVVIPSNSEIVIYGVRI